MKNNYKLICLDLDGTLLTSKKEIDKETLDYIRKLSQRDIKIAVTTGRVSFDAKYHAQLINDKTYFISSNGAAVGFNSSEDLLFEKCFTKDQILEICKICKELKLNPMLYTKDFIICTSIKEIILNYWFMSKSGYNRSKRLKLTLGVNRFLKLYEKNNLSIQKLVLFFKNADLIKEADNKFSSDIFEKELTDKLFYEISSKGVNKGYGVDKLCRHLSILPNEVIAFGDSDNDREMLKFVGKGVAMKNAPKSIRDIADEVTKSNDEQGILVKLKEIFEN